VLRASYRNLTLPFVSCLASLALVPIGAVAGEPVPIDDPIPGSIRSSGQSVRLVEVASGLTAPNWGTFAPGDRDRLFVVDQNGILWAIDLATGDKGVFLDLSDRLVALGAFGPGSFDERGFLGAAFHPDYRDNGLLYTYISEPVGPAADYSTIPPGGMAHHQSVILEWFVPDPADPAAVVDPTSARELLRVDQPQFNHNAGALNFGPDGMLYIAFGDGGAADDQDGQPSLGGPAIGHGPNGNGQNPSTPLGSLLRIDPLGMDSTNGQYGIPPDNPFVGQEGFLDEIYAYGFRNPFRFSFDMRSGTLFLADVGQNDIEEVNVVVAGGNYGWRHKEGSFFFVPNGPDPGFVTEVDPGVPPGLIDPIAEYDHDEGVAVVGGFVYQGRQVPALRGRYIFGEFAQRFSNDGRLFYLSRNNRIREFKLFDRDALNLSLLGFGQDADGEVYVLANATGTPFGDTGVVLRIAPRNEAPGRERK